MEKRIVLFVAACLLLLVGGAFAANQSPAQEVTASAGTPSGAASKFLNIDVPKAIRLNQQPQFLELTGEQIERAVAQTGGQDRPRYFSKAQGGEDIATAVAIDPPPSTMTGTTNGYADDYEGSCILTGGNSEDVVYSYAPSSNEYVSMSLCNASYQTNMWVYQNSAATQVACNRFDNDCALPRSALDSVPMFAGNTYYIVIDGENGASGNYQLDVTTWPLPDLPDTTNIHPAFSDNGNGLLLLGYEDNVWGDSTQPWFGSNDDGNTFPSGGSFTFTANPSYPACDFWGNDTVFYGTLVPPATTLSGAATYLTELANPMNSATWGQSFWDWSGFGWHHMKMVDIACNNSVPFVQQPGVSRFGMLSMVHSTTYTNPDIIHGPFAFYEIDTSIAGRATISWFSDLDSCKSTMNTIDPVTLYYYAVYDRYAGGIWELFIRRDDFGDLKLDANNISGGWTYSMNAGDKASFPSVASYDGNVLIVTEFATGGDTTDHDLIVWIDTLGLGNLDDLATFTVVATTDDERYPRIEHVAGGYYAVTYVANNQLYLTTTSDNGRTWGTPTAISSTDVVVAEYRSHDLTEHGTKAIWEYYSNLPTDSTIRLHFTSTGIVADSDGDQITDDIDNCPSVSNPLQEDADGDLIGDACDACTDTDGDGFGNPGFAANTCADDNCPDDSNPGQQDQTGDGIGDACCCINIRGNVSGGADVINIEDLTTLVGYMFKDAPTPPCPNETEITGNGVQNIEDLTYMVGYMFKDGPAPAVCP